MDDCGAGDAMRLGFCVAAVRRAHPEAQVTMIASAGAASVYSGSPLVDRLIESRLYRRGLSPWRARVNKTVELCRLTLAAGIRNDLVIVFWWGSRLLAVLARIAGRGDRVGYGSSSTRLLSSPLGTFDLQGDEVEQHRRLLAAAGITERPAPTPLVTLSRETQENADRILRESGWDGRAPLVVIHTGSDWACQQWVPERWSEVADTVAASGAHVVFTGSAAEKAYVEVVRRDSRRSTASIAGLTTISDLAAVVRRARLLITVDSAAYVAAHAQGIPSVVLAGPSHPERIVSPSTTAIVKRTTEAKAREIAECKRPRYPAGGCLDYSCPLAGMREISVADVVRAVGSLGSAAGLGLAI
jgi:ADP-heptose:LPS heptosyltransferase